MGEKCGVCNEIIPMDHATVMRKEDDGAYTFYHLTCEKRGMEKCSDCGHHRELCSECAE